MKTETKKHNWLFQLVRNHRFKLIGTCLLALISTLISLVPVAMIYHIAKLWQDRELSKGSVTAIVVIILLSVISRYIFLGLSSLLAHISAYDLLYEIRTYLTAKLGHLPMGYFNQQETGKLKKMLTDDVERFEQFIAHQLPTIVVSIFTPLTVFVFLLMIDWRMAFITLLPVPFAILVQLRRARNTEGIDMETYRIHLEKMNGSVIEFIEAMPLIKAFRMTARSFTKLQDSVDSYTKLWQRISRKKVPTYVLYMGIIESGLLFMVPIGLVFYKNGTLQLPEFILFLLLGVGLLTPLKELSTVGHSIRTMWRSIECMSEVVNEPELVHEKSISVVPKEFSIQFTDVCFRHGETEVLSNVSFKLDEGTISAIVGPSGAGKSTLTELIARYWDVTSGEIRIGNIPINQISQGDLMDSISYVFQKVSVLNDSVFQNIAMGKDYSNQAIIEAAKIAKAHEFILALPNGYDTILGESGVHLSGGERQRIAIARAIIKNAPILILDEATAYTDSENEAAIQEGISRLLKGKTVLVIAHRLSTITDVDQLIVLEDGRVVEKGRHEDLLSGCLLYQNMWRAYTEVDEWVINGREQNYYVENLTHD